MNSHLLSVVDLQDTNESISPQGDVCNRKLVKYIFSKEKVDVVFHLAAKTHVGEQLRLCLVVSA